MASRASTIPLRTLTFRTRPLVPRKRLAQAAVPRYASNDVNDDPASSTSKGPNEDQLPHVSEEQAAIDKSMGNTPPDLDRGTPVKEVCCLGLSALSIH